MHIIYAFVILMCCKSVALGYLNTVINDCSFFSKTNAQIERKLDGNGFHRSLETFVDITSQEDLTDCNILIKDTIPSGAYIDPNQLMFNKEFGGPSFFIPQFVNIESPESSSPKIQAYFFTKLRQTLNGNWHGNISVPVHLRYHRAKHGSHESLKEVVTFPHSTIFVMCDADISEDCLSMAQLEPCPPTGIQQCDWLPVSTFSTGDWVTGVVPVGNVDLVDTVLLATTSITCAAAILLLIAMFRNDGSPKNVEMHRKSS